MGQVFFIIGKGLIDINSLYDRERSGETEAQAGHGRATIGVLSAGYRGVEITPYPLADKSLLKADDEILQNARLRPDKPPVTVIAQKPHLNGADLSHVLPA